MKTLADYPVASYLLDFGCTGIIDVNLVRVEGRVGIRWAIREHDFCFNKSGKWEREPIPSSRTDSFFKRCRWETAESALACWHRRKGKSRFAHYRDPSRSG